MGHGPPPNGREVDEEVFLAVLRDAIGRDRGQGHPLPRDGRDRRPPSPGPAPPTTSTCSSVPSTPAAPSRPSPPAASRRASTTPCGSTRRGRTASSSTSSSAAPARSTSTRRCWPGPVTRSAGASPCACSRPEDLLVIKAVATAEHGPHHWYDALGIIARSTTRLGVPRRHGPARPGPGGCSACSSTPSRTTWPCPPSPSEKLFDIVHPRLRGAAVTDRRRTWPSTSSDGRWRRVRPPSSAVDVQVAAGELFLSGTVASPSSATAAVAIAAREVRRPAGARRRRRGHGEPDVDPEVLDVIRVAAVGDIHFGPDSRRAPAAAPRRAARARRRAAPGRRPDPAAATPTRPSVLADELAGVPRARSSPCSATTTTTATGPTRSTAVLADAGVHVLEGTSTVDRRRRAHGRRRRHEGLRRRLRRARAASEFGEPEMKAFMRHAREVGRRRCGTPSRRSTPTCSIAPDCTTPRPRARCGASGSRSTRSSAATCWARPSTGPAPTSPSTATPTAAPRRASRRAASRCATWPSR